MFSGPDWIFRRASAASSPEKSYFTSSGPKHTSHTNLASRAYSSPHSLHLRASTAMPAPYSLWSPPLASVTEAFGAASPHLPGLNYWWPDGIGTVLIAWWARRIDGCRGFVGPFPSTPLDAYGYVWSGRIQTLRTDSSFDRRQWNP